MDFDSITSKINESQPLDFGTIFNRSIELFKKVWVQGLVTVLLTSVCILPFYILLYVPMIAMGFTDPQAMQNDEPPTSFIIFLALFMPIFMLAVMTISLALNAAFLQICKQKDLDEMGKEDYFLYLKKGNLKKSFILALYATGLSILGMLACGLGVFYVMVPISLLPAFLAFNLTLLPKDIIKASFSLGNKNWLVIFGLLIVMGIIAQLGVLACFIGLLFTAMLARIPIYYMYKDAIGFEQERLNA